MRIHGFFAVLILGGVGSSCTSYLRPADASATYYNISGSTSGADTTISRFIQPYSDSLSFEMNQVIAHSAISLEKGKPESSLGNFVADLLMEQVNKNSGTSDFCIVNYGGLRVPSLPQGQITRRMIYELMPFDNFLVIILIDGALVQQVLDHIASEGGWPVAGIKFKIKDGKAFDILINNLPLQPDKKYRMVISDYLADGGDNLQMLKNLERENTGILIRDAILDFLVQKTHEGKIISSSKDGRVTSE